MTNYHSFLQLLQRKTLFVLFPFVFFLNNISKAQTAITAATTVYNTSTNDSTYIAKGAPGSSHSGKTFTYNYGTLSGTSNNDQEVTDFTAGGVKFSFLNIANMYVKMRRVDNAVVTGVRNLKFAQGDTISATINLNGSYNGDMESFFTGNKTFNSGTDNLFGNQGDGNGNNNNIERVDVIFPTGISASDNSKAGFAIFERGTTLAHDPVKTAVILGLDGSGMPNSYSNIISISSGTYGNTDVIAARNYIIMRRDTATEPFKMSTTTSQAIGGVLFKYSDFGIANNTPIYGYSVIPFDFPNAGTSTDLIDYTNASFFPTNTSSTTGAGGIDLVAFTGVSQSQPVISQPVILAVHLIKFSAQKNNDAAVLQWTTASEENSKEFEIEKSTDGINFSEVASIAAKGNTSAITNYSFNDDISNVIAQAIYYRLKIINTDGSFTYSAISVIENSQTGIKLFPQPIKSVFTLSMIENGLYTISLLSNEGKQLKQWNNVAITQQKNFNINRNNITPGTYYLRVVNIQNDKTTNLKAILQ